MFETLTERLSQALRQVTGRGRISEDNVRDTVRQIRMALLEADVALPVAKAFVERIREQALGEAVAKSLNPGQTFVKIVHDELVSLLGGEQSQIKPRGRPSVLLLVGLQGAGKTTTAGKLARYLSGDRSSVGARSRRDSSNRGKMPLLQEEDRGKTPLLQGDASAAGTLSRHDSSDRGEQPLAQKSQSHSQVLLASTDVYRPAAREQLAKLARELGGGIFESASDDPLVIAQAAFEQAKRGGYRWLIVDTAGRLHVDDDMMAEVRAIHEIVNPCETIFVVDAMIGQDAVNSVSAFNDSLPLTGVILTKTDGDARGGAALSVREMTGLPIKLIGSGEKLDALEAFVPERFASRILGMGDVVGLVEQVEAQVDRDAMERVAGKVKRGRELNLADYREQLVQLASMGGLESLLDKIPGIDPAALNASGFDPRVMRRQIAVIDSMTRRERLNPGMINGSRKRRIATGAGLAVQDVNRLLKQHRQLAKTMKRVAKGGMQRALGAAMRGRGGFGIRK